jgi:hypothetical protein
MQIKPLEIFSSGSQYCALISNLKNLRKELLQLDQWLISQIVLLKGLELTKENLKNLVIEKRPKTIDPLIFIE